MTNEKTYLRIMEIMDRAESIQNFGLLFTPDAGCSIQPIHGIPRLNFLLNGEIQFLEHRNGRTSTAVIHAPCIYYCAANGFQWATEMKDRVSFSFCYFGDYIRINSAQLDGKIYNYHTAKPLSPGGIALINTIEKLHGEHATPEMLKALLLQLYRYTKEQVKSSTVSMKSGVNRHWEQIINYLREHPNSDITRAELAQKFSVSPGTISRLSRKNTGKEFSALMQEFRLNFACQLLKNTSLSIDEIAYKSGFHYSSYFRRCFKKHFGMLPSQYNNGKD